MLAGIVDVSEMRKKEPLRIPRSDGIERRIPQFEIDVRRRRGGEQIRFAFDADAGVVADERDARIGSQYATWCEAWPGV